MKKFLLAAMMLVLVGCSDSDGAKRAVESMGYTNVKTHGWALFGCADDDAFKTKFTATGQNGKPVSGVVCGGFLKGSTVRTD